jgi:hypothetical protein
MDFRKQRTRVGFCFGVVVVVVVVVLTKSFERMNLAMEEAQMLDLM